MSVEFPTNTVILVIAFADFRDEEFFVTKEIIEAHGNKVLVASDTLGSASSVEGSDVWVDLAVDKLEVEKYDAIIFIGGPGTLQRLDNKDSYNVAQAALRAGKIIGAICIAPVILAKSGVLKGKKATVWTTRLDKSAVKILKENEAEFEDNDIVVDGNIITASGPKAAKAFAETIVQHLKS